MTEFVFDAYSIWPEVDGMEIVPAHPQREWMNQTAMPHAPGKPNTERGFANRCLPMLIANQMGWNVINKKAFVATSMPNGRMIFAWSEGEPLHGGPRNNFGENLLTWPSPWTFKTPPGWDLLILPPLNEHLPAHVNVLSALVETDHSPATFTFNWRVEPKKTVWIPAGQPIVRLIPYPTGELEKFSFQLHWEAPQEYKDWLADRVAYAERMHADPENTPWGKAYWKVAKRLKIKKPRGQGSVQSD